MANSPGTANTELAQKMRQKGGAYMASFRDGAELTQKAQNKNWALNTILSCVIGKLGLY